MAASNGIFNGATVTTSNDDSGTYPGANVIDGSNATFWHTANVGVPHWIKFDLGVGVLKAVESYRWTPRSTDDTHSPVTFLFQGSNDDSTWDTIDSQTAQNDWSNGTERTFTVTNCGQYRYYRFYITATLSNTYCCAGEIGADLAGENTIEVSLSSISQWILGGDGWEGGGGLWGREQAQHCLGHCPGVGAGRGQTDLQLSGGEAERECGGVGGDFWC